MSDSALTRFRKPGPIRAAMTFAIPSRTKIGTSGFMQEEEANFIAFLACLSSDRSDFQYSGYLSGWVYCMNALYRADYNAWQEVRVTLMEEAEPDLEANNAFWDSYHGTISETAERINDTYLKANGQAEGVQSYNRMVDLIVAYFS